MSAKEGNNLSQREKELALCWGETGFQAIVKIEKELAGLKKVRGDVKDSEEILRCLGTIEETLLASIDVGKDLIRRIRGTLNFLTTFRSDLSSQKCNRQILSSIRAHHLHHL